MLEKGVITSFLLLLMANFIKATMLGLKLLILAAAGLAGMYMIHLLAQDYNKYQSLNRPGRSVHNVVKRSFDDGQNFPIDFVDVENTTSRNLMKAIQAAEQYHHINQLLTLDRILQFDPTGCARRYVCTIAAKSYKKRTQSERNIINMLRNLPSRKKTDLGHEAFKYALDLGKSKKDASACAEEYPKCMFSVSQMLKLIGQS